MVPLIMCECDNIATLVRGVQHNSVVELAFVGFQVSFEDRATLQWVDLHLHRSSAGTHFVCLQYNIYIYI